MDRQIGTIAERSAAIDVALDAHRLAAELDSNWRCMMIDALSAALRGPGEWQSGEGFP